MFLKYMAKNVINLFPGDMATTMAMAKCCSMAPRLAADQPGFVSSRS